MASVGFRWLDILEKEFDNAFVDLDLSIGAIEVDEPDIVHSVRQKLCTLSSCFAQLTHKAQTIFQNSAKIEAELIHLRAELVESRSKRELLEQEFHSLLLQLHSSQLSHLPTQLSNRKQDAKLEPDVSNIRKRFEDEIRRSSPNNINKNSAKESEELKFSSNLLELAQLRNENSQLQLENANLRNTILTLNSEVYGAKLAAKYLDKELAGRIQQLQLLGREMRGEVRNKLWRQLESEILLQRHKTVVRACRRNSLLNSSEKTPAKPEIPTINELQSFGDIRNVVVKRKAGQGLGISITGGREHGVPILISELEANGPAALSGQLYIGDAILFVNDHDLRQACHREAVEILQQQSGDCLLQVQYIAADDSDNSLEEDGFNFRYRFFDSEVCSQNDLLSLQPVMSSVNANTPTAPRTPESLTESRPPSTDNTKVTNLIVLDDTTTTQNQNTTEDDSNMNIPQTSDLILIDNRTDNVIKLENFKKSNELSENFNCSSNSLNSENLSSPMQTSTDIFLESTDVASNDSQSPKIVQNDAENGLLEMKKFNEFCFNNASTSSDTKSDKSLLNSSSDDGGSPVHRGANRDYKKPPKKHRPKKYFGVTTLQSIFSNKRNGYSDISSTASEEIAPKPPDDDVVDDDDSAINNVVALFKNTAATTTSPEFEENIHSFLSDLFVRNFPPPEAANRAVASRRHGQNLRVGKALRLCPNDDALEKMENEQRKEKLLARYVYNANACGGEGVGDPDFGTPV